MQSRQRFVHQLGAPQRGKVGDGRTKQFVFNFEQTAHRQTKMEGSRAGSACCGGTRVLDVRPPTRVAGREELQVVAQVTSLTRRDDPCSPHDRRRKHSSVPLPLDFSLDAALRKAARLADRAYGVVTASMELAVRVLAADFEEITKLVQPDNCSKFQGGSCWTCLDCRSLGPRCTDRFPCRLDGGCSDGS